MADRAKLRATFEAAADVYDRARPDYPEPLLDALMELTKARPGDHVLEIGCGTGKATRPLAMRGLSVTCVELGADLAAAAQRLLNSYPGVTVVNGDFETWRPPPASKYDLVVAATSWRWLDPDSKYKRAWDLLRPAGHLAFWNASHVFPEGGDLFFREIQSVYDEIGEGLPPDASYPLPSDLPDDRAEIELSGLFSDVTTRLFDWETTYDAEGYIDLLKTFSGHINMEAWQRDRLFEEIRARLRGRPDGVVRRHWGAVLHVARRREHP